jgi:hypothetical protein
LKELTDLAQKCAQSAIDYGVAAYEVITNPKKTNKLYDINRKNFVELKKMSQGVTELFILLDHENPYVKYVAALYLLSIDEKRAKLVISSLVGFSNQLDFSVKYLLIEWNKGNLREYYF